MGKRGPSKTPTVLRLLNGESRASQINQAEPVPRGDLPEPPEDIAADVRKVWDYTVDQLAYMGIAVAADRDALYCYCQAVITHRKAAAILSRSPVLIKGTLGGLIRNPALAVARDAAYQVRQFAQEFGLTPSARTSVQAKTDHDTGESDNPFAGTA